MASPKEKSPEDDQLPTPQTSAPSTYHVAKTTILSLPKLVLFYNYFFFPFDRWMMMSSSTNNDIDDLMPASPSVLRVIAVMFTVLVLPPVAFAIASLLRKPSVRSKTIGIAIQIGLLACVFSIAVIALPGRDDALQRREEFASKNFETTSSYRIDSVWLQFISGIIPLVTAGFVNTILLEMSLDLTLPTIFSISNTHRFFYDTTLICALLATKSRWAYGSLSNVLQTFQLVHLSDVAMIPSPETSNLAFSSVFMAPLDTVLYSWDDFALNIGCLPVTSLFVVATLLSLRYGPAYYSRLVLEFGKSRGFELRRVDARKEANFTVGRRGVLVPADEQLMCFTLVVTLGGAMLLPWLLMPIHQAVSLGRRAVRTIRGVFSFIRFMGLLVVTVVWRGEVESGALLIQDGYKENVPAVWAAALSVTSLAILTISLLLQWRRKGLVKKIV